MPNGGKNFRKRQFRKKTVYLSRTHVRGETPDVSCALWRSSIFPWSLTRFKRYFWMYVIAVVNLRHTKIDEPQTCDSLPSLLISCMNEHQYLFVYWISVWFFASSNSCLIFYSKLSAQRQCYIQRHEYSPIFTILLWRSRYMIWITALKLESVSSRENRNFQSIDFDQLNWYSNASSWITNASIKVYSIECVNYLDNTLLQSNGIACN